MPIFLGKHVCSCHGSLSDFAPASAEAHHAPDLEIEPIHLEIGVELFIPEKKANLQVTHTLKCVRDGAQRLKLNGVALLDLTVEGAEFSYDGQTIDLLLSPMKSGETRKITLKYRVENPASGLLFSSPADAHPNTGSWAVTDHETERARHWLATIDHPSVRPTLEFHLRAPADLTALANGLKTGTDLHDDGTQTTHWKLDVRCPAYLTCFAVGRFTHAPDGEFEGRELAYFAPDYHTEDNLIRSFGRTGRIMSWMTKKFDLDFPFPKYFQFAAPGIGGAMENISLVSWDEIFVLDAKLAEEFTWLVDQINVHEMAHSYFGDLLVCRDFSHVWLKESWATYTEQLWLEDTYGDDEAHYDFFRNSEAYFGEADGSYKRPLVTRKFESSWDMFDRHLYPGGACRLHTLRNEIGDDLFFAGVQDYLKNFAGQVVETEDFRRTLERRSGRTLTWFFDQWMYSPEYLDLKVSYAYDKKSKKGILEVTQKQEGAFTFNLEAVWTVEGKEHSATFRIDKVVQHCAFSADAEPEMFLLNPRGSVLMKLEFDPGETKLREALKSRFLLGRIHAAHQLAEKPTPQNVDAIHAQYQQETFWGGRQQMISALTRCGTNRAASYISEAVSNEEDPMVLQHLFAKAKTYKDESILNGLLERLRKGDLPYFAARSAWSSVGSFREKAPIDEIAQAARQEGFGLLEQWGAIEALGESRQAIAAEVLMERTRDGATSAKNRGAAAKTLGQLGAFLEKRAKEMITEHLTTLLRDENLIVGRGAVDGLAALNAREAAGAVEQFLKRLPRQDAVAGQRTLAKLKAPEAEQVTALEKELEELRKALRGMEERITKLDKMQDKS